jgi:hypothetical protein
MKRMTLAMTLPAVLATSTIFGSSLFPEEEGPPPRNTFFDYALDSDVSDSAYTVGAVVHGRIIQVGYAIGRTGYNQTATATAPKEGSTISFGDTPVVAIDGIARMSNSDTGQVISFIISHHDHDTGTKIVNSLSDSNIQINDPLAETTNATEYSSVSFSLENRQTGLGIMLTGYSLQYKGYALSSNFGLIGSHTRHRTVIAGTKVGGSSDVNKEVALQETYAGGFAGGFDANLVVYATDDGCFYVGTGFEATKEYAKNTGNLTTSQTDGVTSTVTFTHNSTPPTWTRVHSLTKSIYLGYSTIQAEDDTSFLTLKAGLASSIRMGADVLQKTAQGNASDISSISVFGELSYTM